MLKIEFDQESRAIGTVNLNKYEIDQLLGFTVYIVRNFCSNS